MKKSHIFAIVIIAIAIGIIVTTAGDASTYVNFDQAYQMASTGNSTSIHVVGQLKKDSNGEIVGLRNAPDNLSFTFVLVDENGKEQKVFYNEPMPPDFTRSENVVIIGNYQGENFVANKILLKCPSKYQEQSVNAGV
ncbi:MAG: cytochrome c maturation protein CcmE [Cyclobacteriaceae bacterium]|nr:cytochrome c maturation protein CcmE [Cyclobacteriaceae bacterium]HRW98566.1 cytochrome c maturation protein CcmE [Cyclobacteriaceae bacterium]